MTQPPWAPPLPRSSLTQQLRVLRGLEGCYTGVTSGRASGFPLTPPRELMGFTAGRPVSFRREKSKPSGSQRQGQAGPAGSAADT